MKQSDPAVPSRLFGWPLPLSTVWFLFPLAGVTLGASIQPISPHDYWWHLVMGRYIAATGSIPDANIFLYTLESGAPFVDQPWLAQLAMVELRAAAGDVGLIWMRNAMVAASWVAVMGLALRRTRDARVVGIVAIAAVLLSGKTYGVRTQMFALLPYALLLWLIVELATRRLHSAWGLALLPLTAFWANVHGSFAMAPALVFACGASCIFRAWRGDAGVRGEASRWLTALAASLVGGSLTPHGVGVYAYVAELSVYSTVAETVTEWQSPAWNTFYGVALLGAIALGGVVLAWRRRSVQLWEAVLFGATAYLAADALRNFYWFAAVFVVVLSPHIRAVVGEGEGEGEPNGVINAALCLLILSLPLAVQPASPVFTKMMSTLQPDVRRSGPGAVLHAQTAPMALATKLRERGFDGRLFHDQAVGGLVEYVLAPAEGAQVAFVDQRMELIPEHVWRAYFRVSAAEQGWEEALAEYDVEAALLSVEEQAPLIAAMQASEDWVLVGRDEAHVMFVASTSEELTRWR